MPGPLAGLRVLDLSRVLAGPWCTQILADFGAQVIKVEKPGEGDDTRGWGPPFITNPDGTKGDAAYFLSTNRGKWSVEIDMAKPEGQALIRQLAAKSDIVMENFKVGGLKKYGLDYESLKAVNPGLIYCSLTGFGQTGPYAQRAGYDFMIQGMGGIMSVTGQPDGMPGAEPMKIGVAFADIMTGLYCTIGIQAALFHRERTGEGQHIDVALLDSQVGVLANQALNYLVGGKAPTRLGNEHPNIVPYQTFATKDGHIIMAVANDRQFKDYCAIIGVAHLADDERFKLNRGRVERRAELIPLLAGPMKARTTAEWVQAFEGAAIPCGPINSIDQVFANEQVLARGLQIGLTRDDGVQVPGVANPIVFSETPIQYGKAPPRLGDGTEKVLQEELGLSAEEIARLRTAGVTG
ncbi:MAG: CoA transferase [Aestuariivirga sp.]|uniref:CaiB/BaiF CoA transferase family protein n=1 Tax=Aestuariivirga sp. TaxID=2650926 RepID=UPI0025BB98B4|nr:CaiB/BaiF CoA-transferase family protein [Aestuariivirga sp.]MCA3559635.1 CoA transferase [Aestuariivirga sp.]